MRRLLLILLIFITIANLATTKSLSQTQSQTFRTEVKATVGEFYLNVSGYISPFASLSLTTTDGTYLQSAVADQFGNFSFNGIPIKRGFSGFCITAIDFKRIGESVTCFTFPAATDSITMTDIFLPPTLGLLRKVIKEGSSAIAFGYTMPGAKVVLYLNNKPIITTEADENGYYEFNIKNLKAGRYNLYAKARYKEKDSLSPTKQVLLKSVSAPEEITGRLTDLLKKLRDLFTSIARNILWLAIPLIILIIILLKKLYPGWFSKFRRRKLHHWWWVGY